MLSSSPSFYLAVAGVFAVGAIMFTVGSLLVRRTREAQPETIQMLEPLAADVREAPWTAQLTGDDAFPDVELRIDMVERLAMVAEPWCVALLERAVAHDPDARVRDAADNALIVIAAR